MSAPTDIVEPLSCPRCGLTEEELRTNGRMGCADCYTVFAAQVVRATHELHDAPPPAEPEHPPLPWPTRRATPPGDD